MTDERLRGAIAERAARAGGAVGREQFRDDVDAETKDHKNDLVTAADREAQGQVVATVREEFPDEPFLVEEADVVGDPGQGVPTEVETIPDAGPCWVVDPIDGTTNFVRGMPTWATSVVGLVDGEAVGTATYLPILGDMYAAGPESATRDGRPLAVSDRSDPETFAVAAVGWWHGHSTAAFGELCTAVIERFGDLRRIGSFQASLASVADGGLDGAICPTPTQAWDTVAGVHLVRRAGGTVTDLAGDPWEPDSRGLVASNGENHAILLEAATDAAPAGPVDA